MNRMQSLLTVSVAVQAFSLATPICATPVNYNVTGSMDTMNTIAATVDPVLSPSPWPTFSGIWTIDTSAPSITGTFGDFVPYSTAIDLGLFGSAVVNQPAQIYLFNLGTVTYTPDPTLLTGGTLTVGEPMTCPVVDNLILNAQTSSGSLQFDTVNGGASACTGNINICNAHAVHFAAKPDLERFYLTLTFSPNFATFTGTAVGADLGGAMAGSTKTGNTWYCYSFSGS